MVKYWRKYSWVFINKLYLNLYFFFYCFNGFVVKKNIFKIVVSHCKIWIKSIFHHTLRRPVPFTCLGCSALTKRLWSCVRKVADFGILAFPLHDRVGPRIQSQNHLFTPWSFAVKCTHWTFLLAGCIATGFLQVASAGGCRAVEGLWWRWL